MKRSLFLSYIVFFSLFFVNTDCMDNDFKEVYLGVQYPDPGMILVTRRDGYGPCVTRCFTIQEWEKDQEDKIKKKSRSNCLKGFVAGCCVTSIPLILLATKVIKY